RECDRHLRGQRQPLPGPHHPEQCRPDAVDQPRQAGSERTADPGDERGQVHRREGSVRGTRGEEVMSEQGLPGPRGASIILDGAVAIVTGASTGIGRAVAHALHERGARVVVSGRRAQLLDPVARELGGLAVACDVSDYAQVERLVARAVEWGGRLDVMVNNAGIGAFGRVHELDPERTSAMVMTNVAGV